MKKVVALGLATAVAAVGLGALVGCGGGSDLKVGLIALHDSNSTYDKNFIDAMEKACDNKGVELVIKTGIPEDNNCKVAAEDLVDQGCDVIFADSFGHEKFILEVAQANPLVEFCHATGTQAHTAGVANFHNAFSTIYEGRYLAGVAAGMKLVEMHNAGTLKANNYDAQGNIKMGYVGAFPYAEVVSGYTSFFLGARSIVEEETDKSVVMDVTYTSSWYDEAKEAEGARTLISNGAALISQHADSMGAPSACEAAGVPNVSYNGSTEAACPNTFIVSSYINWVPYFEYMIDQTMAIKEVREEAKKAAEDEGKEFDATKVVIPESAKIVADWTGTLATGSTALTAIGAKAPAADTQAKIDAIKAELVAGTRYVFDCATFTVKGENLTTYFADVDDDGNFTKETEAIEKVGDKYVFMESKHRSAPYFDIRIDGITELNANA